MFSITKHPSGDGPARSRDEFVPEVDRSLRRHLPVARLAGLALVAPLAVAITPVSGTVGRWIYVVALAGLWVLIVRAVGARADAMSTGRSGETASAHARRGWTAVAIGAGLVVFGEVAHTIFEASGRVGFLHDADGFRLAAYAVLIFGFGAIVRQTD